MIAISNKNKIFKKFMILILESCFSKFFKIFKELSVEPSFIGIISISFKVCFCRLLILLFRYFSLLWIGRNIDTLGIFIFWSNSFETKTFLFIKYLIKKKKY